MFRKEGMATVIFFLLFQLAQTHGYADLSIGKPATQTPLWPCANSEMCRRYEAGNALDRDTNTCTRSGVIGRYSLSKEAEWQVDLGEIRSIYNIRILFKSYLEPYDHRQRGRFAGFSLHLSNSTNKEDGEVCYNDGPELPPLDFSIPCIGHARYLTFHNERLSNKTYPDGYETLLVTELCEVIVQGCEQGFYGLNCSLPCPNNCRERRCDVINGICLGCLPGRIGKFCEQSCLEGSYGLECEQNCSGHCKDNMTCNHVTGECKYGCAGGWTGSLCNNLCPLGRFGQNCSGICSGHCINDEICSNTDGLCRNGCAPGYKGDKCNEDFIIELSLGKTATQSTVYPSIFPNMYGPHKAVDGDRTTCMRTSPIGPVSPQKTVWWIVDLGGNHNIYSISIDFKDYGEPYEKRQRGRFAGFSLYTSDTPRKEDGHLCYKNTLPSPPLEFNTTCIGYGRYVIYYNERLDGVTYPDGYENIVFTELCEVKIQGL